MNLNVNFKTVFTYLIPLQMRGVSMMDWVGSLLHPLQVLNDQFAAFCQKVRYDLSFNGQVGNLEHVLNDQFDAVNRSIYIVDPIGQYVFTTRVFNQSELQPTAIIYNLNESQPTAILRNTNEVFQIGSVDFIIKIPAVLNAPSTLVRLRGLVNQYCQAGKTFIFEVI